MSDKLQRLDGGSVCLAHASLVTGDSGMCERVDGDLPPELGDDELECGPFSDEVYYVFDWKAVLRHERMDKTTTSTQIV